MTGNSRARETFPFAPASSFDEAPMRAVSSKNGKE
jgi:hypothetical protein